MGKGGSDGASGPVAARRLGLLLFGSVFVVLFLVVAISEGLGDPSVPSGDVLLVEGAPGDVGEVSEADFDHVLELAAVQGGEKEAPKPGDAKYEEAKEAALKSITESIWLQSLAAEWDIEATDQEVAQELKKIKQESFPTKVAFQKFLNESRYTPADIDERVKLQILSKELQEQLKEKAPTPSQDEVETYYETAKDTQFTQKPSRDVRLVVNKDRKQAKEAREALSGDNSAKNWTAVAEKYSEDPSKSSGGLQKGVQEGVLEEPLNEAVFSSPEGQVEGPVETPKGYVVFEVENSTPESVQELKAVEGQIQGTLAQRAEQEFFASYVQQFNIDWTSRTFCADGYVISVCANFESDGRPASAPPACYEADPKGGRPEACPAPVFQLVPAMPGTVTPLEPKGKPLTQRPRPAGEEATSAEGATELPGGAVPPGEVPSE